MLHVDGVHFFLTFCDGWFFELLTAAEFFYDACFFEFAFEFFEGAFDVFAFFNWYNNHFVIIKSVISILDCKISYFFDATQFFLQKN